MAIKSAVATDVTFRQPNLLLRSPNVLSGTSRLLHKDWVLHQSLPVGAHIRNFKNNLLHIDRMREFHHLGFNPLNAELNPIRHLLALVGARHIVHISRVRANVHGLVKPKRLTGNVAVWGL